MLTLSIRCRHIASRMMRHKRAAPLLPLRHASVSCFQGHRFKIAWTSFTPWSTSAIPVFLGRGFIALSFCPIFLSSHSCCGVSRPAEFRKTFERPILAGMEPDCSDKDTERAKEASSKLSSISNKFILRRTNTLLAKHLPTKLIEVVCCKPTPLQVALYNHFLKSKAVKKAILEAQLAADEGGGAASGAGGPGGGGMQVGLERVSKCSIRCSIPLIRRCLGLFNHSQSCATTPDLSTLGMGQAARKKRVDLMTHLRVAPICFQTILTFAETHAVLTGEFGGCPDIRKPNPPLEVGA